MHAARQLFRFGTVGAGAMAVHYLAVRRFFATAVLGLLVNESLLALLLAATGLRYRAALALVLVAVAALTYLLARFWAFATVRTR